MPKFLISWDNTGLEGVVPIDEYQDWDKQKVVRILLGTATDRERNPMNGIMQSMLLRAQFNPQQHYEIYAIETTEGIEEAEVRNMFNDAPQQAADTIREIGIEIYSDRASAKDVVIV
jgi:hypothetical protein